MRNTDPDPQPFQPLGPKVTPPAPPPPPEWKQKPGAAKGVEINSRGELRTNLPLP